MRTETSHKNKEWYQKNLGIIIMIVLFFPVGLILMWMYSTWQPKIKVGISGFFVLMLIAGSFVGEDSPSTPLNALQEKKMQINSSSPTQNVNPTKDPEKIRMNKIEITPSVNGFEITNNEEFVIAICRIVINAGIIDSGYTYMMGDYLEAGKTKTISYGEFTKGDGTRYNILETKPQKITLDCDVAGEEKGYAILQNN